MHRRAEFISFPYVDRVVREVCPFDWRKSFRNNAVKLCYRSSF
jgi:hypothetical protein